MSSFGSQLRGIRKDRGLRQKDLAEELQVAQTTIANYEQGTRFPDEATLHRLADFFGVSLDFLMGRTETTGAVGTAVEPDRPLPPEAIRYLELVLDHQLDEAGRLIDSYLERNWTVMEIYMQIFQPVMWEVGRRWETGDMDVSEEHFCSEVTQAIMSKVIAGIPTPKNHARVFVGFSVSGELHDIGIQMVCDLLLLKGWRAVFHGNNLPIASVLKEIRDHRADVVGISASMSYHVNSAANMIQVIRTSELPRALKIVVGGRVFNQEPELWRQVGADGYASDAARAVETISGLVDRGR